MVLSSFTTNRNGANTNIPQNYVKSEDMSSRIKSFADTIAFFYDDNVLTLEEILTNIQNDWKEYLNTLYREKKIQDGYQVICNETNNSIETTNIINVDICLKPRSAVESVKFKLKIGVRNGRIN